MESGRLNKRATASRDSHAGTQHTPTASTTTHNHKHITHTHTSTTSITYGFPTNLCPGAPPLDPAGGYAPRPPILALRARFLNKMKQIQLAKKSTFSAVRRYVTAQFSTISDSYAPIPTPGVPQNAGKPIPTHRPRSPLPAGRKKIWGEKCSHDEKFWGVGAPVAPTRLTQCFVIS